MASPTPSPAAVYSEGWGCACRGAEKHAAHWHDGDAGGMRPHEGRVFEDKATLITPVWPHKIDLPNTLLWGSTLWYPLWVRTLHHLKGNNFSKAVLLQL